VKEANESQTYISKVHLIHGYLPTISTCCQPLRLLEAMDGSAVEPHLPRIVNGTASLRLKVQFFHLVYLEHDVAFSSSLSR
jgi:hypothetical protein